MARTVLGTPTSSKNREIEDGKLFQTPLGQPVHFFLEPEMPKLLLESFQKAIESRGGYVLQPGDSTPESGIILVDPRTRSGSRYIKGYKKDSPWPVISYTYIRACIFKNILLEPAAFTGVFPLFEVGMKALRIHIHSKLKETLTEDELSELRLLISKYGGNSSHNIEKSDVIITLKGKYLDKLRDQYDHSPIHVESHSWVTKSIERAKLVYSDQPLVVSPIKASPGTPFRRREYSAEQDKELVKFLAEWCPTDDNNRSTFRIYKYLTTNISKYPWAEGHTEGSWQNHYAKDKERFDAKIKRYVEAHPELQLSETEAEAKRVEEMGSRKRKRGKAKHRPSDEDEDVDKGAAESQSEEETAKTSPSKKKRIPKGKSKDRRTSVAAAEESDSLPEQPAWTPRSRSAKTAAKEKLQVVEPARSEPEWLTDEDAAPSKIVPKDDGVTNSDDELTDGHDQEVDQLADDLEDSLGQVREAPPNVIPDAETGDLVTRALGKRPVPRDQYSRAVRRGGGR